MCKKQQVFCLPFQNFKKRRKKCNHSGNEENRSQEVPLPQKNDMQKARSSSLTILTRNKEDILPVLSKCTRQVTQHHTCLIWLEVHCLHHNKVVPVNLCIGHCQHTVTHIIKLHITIGHCQHTVTHIIKLHITIVTVNTVTHIIKLHITIVTVNTHSHPHH